MIETLMKMQ